MRKYAVVILNQLNNNKIDKDNFEKKIITKKNHVGNTVAIHSVLKKTIKLNFQPAQYLKNQINKNNSAKKKENFGKKIKNKKNRKKTCGES